MNLFIGKNGSLSTHGLAKWEEWESVKVNQGSRFLRILGSLEHFDDPQSGDPIVERCLVVRDAIHEVSEFLCSASTCSTCGDHISPER